MRNNGHDDEVDDAGDDHDEKRCLSANCIKESVMYSTIVQHDKSI